MAINFYNIRSRERRVADTEPLIAALYNSSDLGVNGRFGQDFGWRLAPEVALQLKRIKGNPLRVQEIAILFKKSPEEVQETDILKFISDQTTSETAPIAEDTDFEQEYLDEIRRLEKKQNARIKKDMEKLNAAEPEISEDEDEESEETDLNE